MANWDSWNPAAHASSKYFSSTSNWRVPTGVRYVLALGVGGGAAGHGSYGGCGGGAFAAIIRVYPGYTMGITIGSGGTTGSGGIYGSYTGTRGGGGNTTFGNCIAYGGQGGDRGYGGYAGASVRHSNTYGTAYPVWIRKYRGGTRHGSYGGGSAGAGGNASGMWGGAALSGYITGGKGARPGSGAGYGGGGYGTRSQYAAGGTSGTRGRVQIFWTAKDSYYNDRGTFRTITEMYYRLHGGRTYIPANSRPWHDNGYRTVSEAYLHTTNGTYKKMK